MSIFIIFIILNRLITPSCIILVDFLLHYTSFTTRKCFLSN